MIIRCPLSDEGMIKHHHGDKIPAFLLRFSHSERNSFQEAAPGSGSPGGHYSRWPDPWRPEDDWTLLKVAQENPVSWRGLPLLPQKMDWLR